MRLGIGEEYGFSDGMVVLVLVFTAAEEISS
jgi:hypothetical protein